MAKAMKDSGVAWIGEIPDGWKIRRIKTLFKLRDEKNYKPLSEVNLISLYTDKGVMQHSDIEYFAGNKASNADGYKCVYENDIVVNIILCWMGAIGRSAYNGVTSPAYDVYFPLSFVNSNYYHYLFRTNGFNGECFKRGRGIMLMRWRTYSDDFSNISVPFPPLPQQQSIANFLDKKCSELDSILTKIRESIEEYKKLKQSIITQAVTKGIRPNRKMKDSGIEWIGEIPEEWEIKRFKQIGNARNGLTYEPTDICDENEGTLVLRSSNIKNNKLNLDDRIYVRTNIKDELMVKENDILICSRNGSAKLIGKNAIIPKNLTASFGAFMLIYRCKAPVYVQYLLSSDVFLYNLGTFLTVSVNQLTINNFNNIHIPVPSEIEQEELINYLDKRCSEIDMLVTKKEQLITELEAYKKALIYEYVTGKKEVK